MALAIGWVVGAVAAVWFVVWFGALALYVDDFSIETVPAIAYTPSLGVRDGASATSWQN